MELKALIIDDEAQSRAILGNYLSKYCPEVKVLGEAENIEKGMELIKKHQSDMIFLDVEMPFGNAFDLLERLPDRQFETIFVTAYQQYAKDALNSHAAYYLMKPIAIDELIAAVNYVLDIKTKESRLDDRILKLNQKVSGKITIPQQDGFEVLEVSGILYCQADDNYTRIFLEDRKLLVSKTLKYFETALEAFPFARVHKSFLVNVAEVVKYRKGKGGSVVLSNGKEIIVSPSRKRELLAYFE